MRAGDGGAGGRQEEREGPLSGRTVVVTRPRAKAGEMMDAFRRRGARVLLAPAVEIVPPAEPEPFRRALADLDGFDWVVLTSASAVEAVLRMREVRNAEGPPPKPRRLAVVGPATASAARRLGWAADLVPDEYTAEGLLEALLEAAEPPAGRTMLLLLAEAARDVLPDGLRARGVRVTRVTAYRSVPAAAEDAAELAAALEAGEVDLLTFTSPSTAARFLDGVGPVALRVPAAVIGPVTAEAAAELGFRVAAVAEEHTIPGLVGAVERLLDPVAGGPSDPGGSSVGPDER